MSTSWRWIVVALCLTLVGGASLGVVADRIWLDEREAQPRSSGRADGTIWFDCSRPAEAEASQEVGDAVGKSAARDAESDSGEHREWRSRRFESLRQELQLDDEQVVQVRETFDEHRALARRFWRETREEYCSMRERLRDDIRAILRPAQQELFERRLERIDARERERMTSERDHRGRRRHREEQR